VRLSDARYARDLLRYRLALRLVQFEARTRTIERWTGLSMHRVRTLRAYAADMPEVSNSPLRGVSPYQPGFFFRSAHVKSEAAVLAGFLHVCNVVPTERIANAEEVLPNLTRGVRLCRAYQHFRACLPATQISIEHAILLLIELTRGVEVTLSACNNCDALIVIDRLAVAEALCSFCQHRRQARLPHSSALVERSPAVDSAEDSNDSATGVQGNLF
jgi:hypothetical protein